MTRANLIGRDMVVVRDEHPVTELVPGILIWTLQQEVSAQSVDSSDTLCARLRGRYRPRCIIWQSDCESMQ